jgi:DNA-binding IclR family transcriptional regulator
MRRLSQETGESVYLSMREGARKVCVGSVESKSTPIKYAPTPGSVAPLHAGASGKVLLAFRPEEEIRELVEKGRLVSVTPKTIIHKSRLMLRLTQIRRNGYDYSEGELVLGTWALAFPVLDPSGYACASLTLAGTLLHTPGPRMKRLVDSMRRAVRRIESELWREQAQDLRYNSSVGVK